ncbi:TPA: hypothetical protein N0F65_007650 [Lagenidium giganteum]|uniref:Cystathionine gamma-synthase n=1 Tax=Lagenidium giganteum TaxID=4803 RepID=A0AAV2ZCB5_9STRA|nr:TPA: hypothetical protein N0F65_007650 [Lagenidium giganteum]
MAPALVTHALGVSLPPGDEHAVSVSIPKWAQVIGYEEGDPAVLDALACGYPRFFRHPLVSQLVQRLQSLRSTMAPGEDWTLLPVPTEATAERFKRFLDAEDPEAASAVVECVANAIWVVHFPQAYAVRAKAFWQHTGEIVSSRQAARALRILDNEDAQAPFVMLGTNAHSQLRQRIADRYQLPSSQISPQANDVFVYPTGMGAIFAAVRHLTATQGPAKSIMFGFPYVDSLKILQRTEWSHGVYFFPVCGEKELQEVEKILASEKILGIFTEFPGNPLLTCPDIERLAKLAHSHGTALVVDDTIGSFNVNVMKNDCADIVATSLSKIFSGTCNIMGGSIVLNPNSTKYEALRDHLALTQDAFLFEEDAHVLLASSSNLTERLATVNATASVIARRLRDHPLVESIYYPETNDDAARYKHFITDQAIGGFGPLLSIVLNGGGPVAQAFYDALDVAKGPSLGTNFTLCCPYTLLAHFHELEFVEACGVNRNLIRISIGLEDVEQLWHAIVRALERAQAASAE